MQIVPLTFDDEQKQVDEILQSYGLGDCQGTTICAKEGDLVVGCVSMLCRPDRVDTWLNCCATRQGYRKRGIATALIQAVIDGLSLDRHLWLETELHNEPFYAKRGFIVANWEEWFDGDPRARTNTVLMRLVR